MPKPHTFPTLYDNVLQLNITKLKKWYSFNSEQIKRGTLTWSSNGTIIDRISVEVNTEGAMPFIRLTYNYQDEPRNYKVRLVSIPSNLGKGLIWYFLCPQTKKRCRRLYLVGGYFLHREAFNGCMYESQTHSKKWRNLEKMFGNYFDLEKYYKELHSKHFTKFYNGVPTKRYRKLRAKIKDAKSFSAAEIESLFLL